MFVITVIYTPIDPMSGMLAPITLHLQCVSSYQIQWLDTNSKLD